MDVFEAVNTRLEVREFSDKPVPDEVKLRVLEAARLSPSGVNTQHWRFILVDKKQELAELAEMSTTGKWVSGAAFAIIVLTDPKYPFHKLDAGRAISYMQLVAWENGVGSCIYTGIDDQRMRVRLDIPSGLEITAVVGFGYPKRHVIGRKSRLPLESVAFQGKYGAKLALKH
ncbi:MAG: nitroreductase family protein [Thermoprotei archaeon]